MKHRASRAEFTNRRRPGQAGWLLFGVFPGVMILVGLLIAARPAAAGDVFREMGDFVREKAGFLASYDDRFVFAGTSKSYRAYAGDASSFGGHRIMLARDGKSIDIVFRDATPAVPQSSVLGAATSITKEEQSVLDEAAAILLPADQSDEIVNTKITQKDRVTLTTAKIILDTVAPTVETEGSRTGSAVLSQADEDFLLLVRLKQLRILRLSRNLDDKLDAIARDVSDIVSKAKLKEEPSEHNVLFANLRTGLDIVYKLNSGGVAQEITLSNKEQLYSVFTFALVSDGLTYADIGQGVWYFRDDQRNVLRIAKGYAKDASGAFTNDIETRIYQESGQDQLTISIPQAWVTAQERVYPIILTTSFEVVPELR